MNLTTRLFASNSTRCITYQCLLYIVFTLSMCLSHQMSRNPTVACKMAHDHTYDGIILDCSHCGLSSDDIPRLNFLNITTLIMSDNNIRVFRNESFLHFRHLKQLECVSCNLNHLERDALKGLETLEVLVLSQNFLKIINHAFPKGFFCHVPYLKKLNIEWNGNNGYASNYSDFIDLFDWLPRLTDLSIDSFSRLRIGKEFTKLTTLNTLTVFGKDMEVISNDSLEGFQDSNIRQFMLIGGNIYRNQLGYDAFQYLPNISSLSIRSIFLGNLNVLKMMQPLQGRHMDEISLYSLGLRHGDEIHYKVEDRVLTSEATQYLKEICVSRFVWKYNNLIAIDPDAFFSERWKTCLKSITLITGGSNIDGDSVMFYKLNENRNLESFIYMGRPTDIGKDFWRSALPIQAGKGISQPQRHLLRQRALSQNMVHQSYNKLGSTQSKHNSLKFVKNTESLLPPQNNSLFELGTIFSGMGVPGLSSVSVGLPIHLQILVLDQIGRIDIDMDISFKKNNLRCLYFRNNRGAGVHLNGRLIGLTKLMAIDFTNTITSGRPTFFKWFPSLSRLVLRNTNQNSDFFSQTADNVPRLIYYDIAENHLDRLPKETFRHNRQLKYLCLASNRFSGIPFDLKLTPNLEILDLRGNSLVELSLQERQAIDDLVHSVPNATFLISNNLFSCTCSGLPFLKWLFNSKARFDQGRNYTCMAENGSLTFTGLYADTEFFWRQCQGHNFFLISLVLVSVLVAFYLLVYLAIKHKTHIISKVRQIVVPGFRLKTRQNFTCDVFIGYADQDVEYVRSVLLRYLETKWHLRTFVHQRDLRQDPLLMSHALQDSWRTVLLITENFLNGYAMAHNVMKTATFFVSPANPRSVVVMVEERVRHQIPDYVHQVVDEDNIIVLPRLETFLDYETEEFLKTRIM